MKSIKNHVMFILPLLAILLGIESFMVFGRVTASYGENLKEAYTILVVTRKPMDTQTFHQIDPHIERAVPVERAAIVDQITEGMTNVTTQEILEVLPRFYTLHLNRYLDSAGVEAIKKHLIRHPDVRRVETFGRAHNANYNLYMLIRTALWAFVGFMIFSSLFLVLKQMEIWQLEHKERMLVMEILGASGMLRSGVLFRIALTDALVAAVATIGLFAFLRYYWAVHSKIDLLIQKRALLFEYQDIAVLLGVSVVIILVSVVFVAHNLKEVRDA